MEYKDVQALQHTPRPSTSLEVVAHPALFLRVSLPRLRTLYLVSHFYDIPLAMSIPVGATNQPGSMFQNASAADGQGPNSSASIGSSPAAIAPSSVCVLISKGRIDSTITHHIGLSDGGLWEIDLGECEDASGEYCHISLLVSLLT